MSELATQRRTEVRALARTAFDEIAGAVGGISSIHRSVSDRIFATVGLGVGSAHTPVKAIHDAITDVVYTAVAESASLAGKVAEQTVDLPNSAPLSHTSRGAGLIAAVQGLVGDTLEAEGHELATSAMSVRVAGVEVSLDKDSLATTFPAATPHLVVFLHGLVESEYAWKLGGRPTYGDRLVDDLDATPIYIRYNSGRRISDNARSLAELMDELVGEWPVPVERISFVGHSMGGLIARGACCLGSDEWTQWVHLVRHTVCLGSPHLGAPLERLVHYGSAALNVLPETRPFSRLLRRRSGGIRDLFAGSLVDQDWRDRDPDALRIAACQEVPLLFGAKHYFVSATITRSPRHPLGRIIGDGLVLVPSASGSNKSRRIGFEVENGMHIGSANHFSLLNNESVYEKLLTWLR